MSKEKKKVKIEWKRLKATSNFYPTYVEGNLDKVTPTSSPYSTQFQTVIPRYDLSMSETRNAGTGPNFLEIEYEPPSKNHRQKLYTKDKEKKPIEDSSKRKRNTKKKIRTDIWE